MGRCALVDRLISWPVGLRRGRAQEREGWKEAMLVDQAGRDGVATGGTRGGDGRVADASLPSRQRMRCHRIPTWGGMGSDTFSIPNEVRPHRATGSRPEGRGSGRTRLRRVPTLKTADAMSSHPYLGQHEVRHVQHSERSQNPSRRPCLDKGGGGCRVGGVSLRMRIHYPRVASSR